MVANSLAKSRGFDRVGLAEVTQCADVEVDPLKEQGMKRARELGVLAMVLNRAAGVLSDRAGLSSSSTLK